MIGICFCTRVLVIVIVIDPVIVIKNTKILNVKQCKYLGVCIDNDLKWTEHINLL